jgi:NADPH2:quinone reductase
VNESMQAVLVSAFDDLDGVGLSDIPTPEPGPAQVLVQVAAVPVNYVDLVTMRGEYQFTPPLPYVPGKGPAGTIAEIGSSVQGLAVGDRVLAMAEYGGYAQGCVVNADQVYRLPDDLTFESAAAMSLAFDTAWMALVDRARVQKGDRVFVLGASGAVGSAAIQLAQALGAAQVIAGVSRASRFTDLQALGADSYVDLSVEPLRETVRERVNELTDGHGADVVIDMLGGDPFDGAVRSVAWRGRLVIVGFASGRIPTVKLNYPLLKNIEISGLQISDYRKRTPELMQHCYAQLFELITNGRITPPPVDVRHLKDWRSAVEDLAGRKATSRLVLRPEPVTASPEHSQQ